MSIHIEAVSVIFIIEAKIEAVDNTGFVLFVVEAVIFIEEAEIEAEIDAVNNIVFFLLYFVLYRLLSYKG